MRKQTHDMDFCVVGGGMAGLLAAVRIVFDDTWGAETVHVFGFDVK